MNNEDERLGSFKKAGVPVIALVEAAEMDMPKDGKGKKDKDIATSLHCVVLNGYGRVAWNGLINFHVDDKFEMGQHVRR